MQVGNIKLCWETDPSVLLLDVFADFLYHLRQICGTPLLVFYRADKIEGYVSSMPKEGKSKFCIKHSIHSVSCVLNFVKQNKNTICLFVFGLFGKLVYSVSAAQGWNEQDVRLVPSEI